MPSWIKDKTNNEIVGYAIDAETAFMSLLDDVPVETVNKDIAQNDHENLDDDEESI